MTPQLVREQHTRGLGHTGPYLGCPGCVDAGVFLCPGCLEPGPGVNGRGRHTGCVEPWRWALFAGFLLLAGAVLVTVLGLVVAFPRIAMALFVGAVLLALAWPHRIVLLAWVLRPRR